MRADEIALGPVGSIGAAVKNIFELLCQDEAAFCNSGFEAHDGAVAGLPAISSSA